MSLSTISGARRRLVALRALLAPARTRFAALAAPHLAAFAVALTTESDIVSLTAFLLFWGLLNSALLLMLRRPVAAGATALAFVVLVAVLSWIKYGVLFMTINFLDVMIPDTESAALVLAKVPYLDWTLVAAVLLIVPVLISVFRRDPFRVRRSLALLAATACLTGLAALSLASIPDPYDEYYSGQYVSKFARSGVTGIAEYLRQGLIDADTTTTKRLAPIAGNDCAPTRKLPHIVMVFDESSFNIGVVPGLKLPADYQQHFRSFDGKQRLLVVEGAGGPSLYTEYNALTGLSALSYGRFSDFVTRVAAGRVERGLPNALRRCGYKTFSFYPFFGAFLSARRFQMTAGIDHFFDAKDLGTPDVEHDGFYLDAAARVMARERGGKPLFLFVYTLANHFPWDYRFRPERTPGWSDPGNDAETDEYLRRQRMSADDYGAFVARLQREFPDEPFLIVRFGDHQPSFARRLIDPRFDDSLAARRIALGDPRFLTTYYTIDALNFRPADLSSALGTLDAPYLPLVVLEAAGLPLDPSFAEQKKILQRCNGQFHRCAGGAEARRFNRLLIDAGYLKRL